MKLKLPANERLQYLAGQYVDFLLKDGLRRSFSIATPPHDDALLELHVRHVPGGRFTDQLFNEFKGREILRFEGPLGSFYLREDSDKPIILVAGGTGFAPIKAVIEHALHHRIDRQMVLYWGARAPARPLPARRCPGSGSSSIRTSPSSRCCPSPRRTTRGRAARAWSTRRCSTTSPISPASRSTPAARRRWSTPRGRRSPATARLPEDEFFADSFTYAAATTDPRP